MIDSVKWVKRAFLTLACITIVVVGVCGLLFGKLVEATIIEEVAKWALMALVLAGIVCGIAYAPVMIAAHRREMLKDEFGKK